MDTIVISGLRRSGTTALWQCFRGLDQVQAFDEPFHPRLAEGARSNPKGTWTELAAFVDAKELTPVAIAPEDELSPDNRPQDRAYMQTLTDAAPRVVMDIVRGWNRVPALYPEPGRVLTVQLIRDPGSWVTGHLMPSGQGTWRKTLADFYRRHSFFTRRGFFDNYHYETIIAEALFQNHPLWGGVAMSVEQLKQAPAYIKLLAFWWGANMASYQALKAAGAQSCIVTLSEFGQAPDPVLAGVLAQAGWSDLHPQTAHVRVSRAPFGTAHPKWLTAARALDIPVSLFAQGGATAQALETAFEASLAKGRRAI